MSSRSFLGSVLCCEAKRQAKRIDSTFNMQGANQELPAERRPMIGKNVHTRRIVASAASLAAMAAAVATGVVLSRASPIKMVERMPDNGEVCRRITPMLRVFCGAPQSASRSY